MDKSTDPTATRSVATSTRKTVALGTTTCISPSGEAEERAAQLLEILEYLNDKNKKARLIARYLLWLSDLGGEAEPTRGRPQGRQPLRELQRDFADRLETLIGRPVLPPDLKAYSRERLVRLTRDDIENGMARRPWEMVGEEFHASDSFKALRGVELEDSRIIDSRFTGVDFAGAEFGQRTVLSHTQFHECNFDGARAEGLRASSVVFKDCSFNSASFAGGSFGYCVFESTGKGSASDRVGFNSVAFTSSNLIGLNMPRARIVGASFTECDLRGSIFKDGEGLGAVFCRTSLKNTDLSGMRLRDAVFRQCDVRGATFTPSENRETDLNGADLRHAYHLDGAAFSNQHRLEARWPAPHVDEFLMELDELYSSVTTPQ